MNGVAREFWSEVFDLSTPVSEEGGGGGKTKKSKSRRKLARRMKTPRPPRTSAA